MCLKENTCFNLYLLITALLVSSCAVPPPEDQEQVPNSKDTVISGRFALPQQKAPPKDIQSIQLYAKGDPANPPVIKLGSEEKLILSFDYLVEQNEQFQVEVSHRTQTWEESSIPRTVYLDSFIKTYIQSSRESLSQRPSYQHIEYEFPNNQLSPTVSGNYLIEVSTYDGGKLLFSMPFFITEDRGTLNTRIETLFAQREDGRAMDQLFTSYRYPAFVEFPQFDLSLSYVQNEFWGRMREVENLSTINPGVLNGHLNQEASFISGYNFKSLDLRTFDVDGRQITDYLPEFTPPRVILQRDVQNLDSNAGFFKESASGNPVNDRGGSYATVVFHLETDSSISTAAEIYLTGDFNNWMINSFNKMRYDTKTGLWEGQALIKQGQYTYNYVLVRKNKIDDLSLDNSFLSSQQEYLTFIYFKDPTHNYDRLLKIARTIKR